MLIFPAHKSLQRSRTQWVSRAGFATAQLSRAAAQQVAAELPANTESCELA